MSSITARIFFLSDSREKGCFGLGCQSLPSVRREEEINFLQNRKERNHARVSLRARDSSCQSVTRHRRSVNVEPESQPAGSLALLNYSGDSIPTGLQYGIHGVGYLGHLAFVSLRR